MVQQVCSPIIKNLIVEPRPCLSQKKGTGGPTMSSLISLQPKHILPHEAGVPSHIARLTEGFFFFRLFHPYKTDFHVNTHPRLLTNGSVLRSYSLRSVCYSSGILSRLTAIECLCSLLPWTWGNALVLSPRWALCPHQLLPCHCPSSRTLFRPSVASSHGLHFLSFHSHWLLKPWLLTSSLL